MATATLDDMDRMRQPKQLGDLVQNMSGDLGIVVRTSPCGPHAGCTGDIGIRHLGKPYMGVGCTRSGDWKLLARAAELAVSRAENPQLAATDDWGRPRCQEIGTYVDVDEDYQCAMVVGHDGDCDPLPVYPDAEPQDGQESPSLLNRMIEEINTNPITRRAFGRLSELDRVR